MQRDSLQRRKETDMRYTYLTIDYLNVVYNYIHS